MRRHRRHGNLYAKCKHLISKLLKVNVWQYLVAAEGGAVADAGAAVVKSNHFDAKM